MVENITFDEQSRRQRRAAKGAPIYLRASEATIDIACARERDVVAAHGTLVIDGIRHVPLRSTVYNMQRIGCVVSDGTNLQPCPEDAVDIDGVIGLRLESAHVVGEQLIDILQIDLEIAVAVGRAVECLLVLRDVKAAPRRRPLFAERSS